MIAIVNHDFLVPLFFFLFLLISKPQNGWDELSPGRDLFFPEKTMAKVAARSAIASHSPFPPFSPFSLSFFLL